tara:strand:- start:306 stop:449 length:144 start_codon:yes stop_codon:yes gene_type:complete
VEEIWDKNKIFDFAHRSYNLIYMLWKNLLKKGQKVDNSRGAASNQGF